MASTTASSSDRRRCRWRAVNDFLCCGCSSSKLLSAPSGGGDDDLSNKKKPPSQAPPDKKASSSSPPNNNVWLGRMLFLVVLCLVAAAFGFGAYMILTLSESHLAEKQFGSIADRALDASAKVARQRRWAVAAMAAVASEMHPNAEEWPFVLVPGFERISSNILLASTSSDMSFLPIIRPEQQEEFEAFAYDYYERTFPPGTAVSAWGKGIFNYGKGEPPNNRYPSVAIGEGEQAGNSTDARTRNILTPVLQEESGPNNKMLMMDFYAAKQHTKGIDEMMDCAQERAVAATLNSTSLWDPWLCGVTSSIMYIRTNLGKPGVAIYVPIFPANDPTKIVGFIATVLYFEEALMNVFSDEVSGIDCVMESEMEVLTFRVEKGKSTLVGVGDLHDPRYNHLRRSVVLAEDDFFTDSSPTYTLHVYPNDQFYQVYKTKNPMVAMVGAVAILVLMTLAFFLYDYYVRREFNAKQELLHAKRQFMRFVSHEVRTPLNSVCMGLALLQTEIAESLGYGSANCPQMHQDLLVKQQSYNEANNNASTSCLSATGSAKRTSIRLLVDEALSSKGKSPSNLRQSPTAAAEAAFLSKSQDWFILSREIEANAQGAVDVLNDLLNYDKIEQGTFSVENGLVPIWQLMQDTAEEFKLPASKKNIDFGFSFYVNTAAECGVLTAPRRLSNTCKLPANVRSLRVVGDAVRVSQVLRNLISNALKFTPQEGRVLVQTCWIPEDESNLPRRRQPRKNSLLGSNTFRRDPLAGDGGFPPFETLCLSEGKHICARPGGFLQVNVEDSGAGLSEDQLSRLFEDGIQFNVNKLQAGKGSGLGLYIAKGIVEQHGGTLEAYSTGLGKGTTFTLTLPLWYVANNDDVEDDMSESASSSELSLEDRLRSSLRISRSKGSFRPKDRNDEDAPKPLPSLRVLVVDDVSSNRRLLCRLLQNRGHTCDNAENGAIAVQMFHKARDAGTPYDSIVMDFEMPVMNGPDATKAIRESSGTDIPIVGITGNVLPDDVSHFLACGATDVLPKPLKMADLEKIWSKAASTDSLTSIDSPASAPAESLASASFAGKEEELIFCQVASMSPSSSFEEPPQEYQV